MALTDRLTTAKSELESYLDSVRGAKLEQTQINRLLTLNSLLGVGASGVTSSVVFASPQAVTQSGTWNVGVTGSLSLPTNASTSALQITGNTNLSSVDAKLPASLGIKTADNSLSFTPASDAIFAVTGETGFIDYRNTVLTNTASQIKATAGQTRGWNFINSNTVPVYVKFYNALAASVVVGTNAVVRTLAIPSGGAFFLETQSVAQNNFLTAISIACVTGLADNSTTAPTILIHAEVRYK